MAKATWNGVVIADTPDTVMVENNYYFPLSAVDPALLRSSDTTTDCPWKGTAHYYTLVAGGSENTDAVWYYPDPKPAAVQIKGRVAFWKGVQVA